MRLAITVRLDGKEWACENEWDTAVNYANWLADLSPETQIRERLVGGGYLVLGREATQRAAFEVREWPAEAPAPDKPRWATPRVGDKCAGIEVLVIANGMVTLHTSCGTSMVVSERSWVADCEAAIANGARFVPAEGGAE